MHTGTILEIVIKATFLDERLSSSEWPSWLFWNKLRKIITTHNRLELDGEGPWRSKVHPMEM